ncbi:Symplekin [Fragariocoptes setiger]|uniref:Tyrosine--tRNA ligase n=1 Tax=Fragariocoptes setiger TaxID=1670756 RepID=A0ABQ7S5V3_9ACAR|nr:Symplekin [Fragariocoptes setiger]
MNRVTDLINQAIVASNASEKVECLYKVQELALNHGIIDNFLEEILAFQNDRSPAVRKFAVGFIEESCKKDGEIFPKSIINLTALLTDDNADVVKRATQASTQLFKYLIKWTATKAQKYRQQLPTLDNNNVEATFNLEDDVVEQTWRSWHNIKQIIFNSLENSQNDGVRTQCIKFVETTIILQTPKDKYTDEDHTYNIHDALVSLTSTDSDAPSVFTNQHKEMILEEAEQLFEQLIIFHGKPHISSVNLMATMQSLALISRQRSQFMSKVITAFEALNVNLPPTLTTSQVHSVRKFLKLQLLILLKHPYAATTPKFNLQITQLLADVGASQSEINKCLLEVRKKGYKIDTNPEIHAKRLKLDHDSANEIDDDSRVTQKTAETAIDITTDEIYSHLTKIEKVADLVIHSLINNLPPTMPPIFVASYNQASVSHTPAQVMHTARLLASQLTAAGMGRGVEEMVSKMDNERQKQDRINKIATVVSRNFASENRVTPTTKKIKLQQVGKPIASVRNFQLNLDKVTKELEETEKRMLVVESVKRILSGEKKGPIPVSHMQVKKDVLSRLAHEFHDTQCIQIIRDYVYDDFKNRHEIFAAIIKRLVDFGKDRAMRRQHLVQSIPGNDPNDLYLYNPRLQERDARELARLHVARDLANQYYDSVKSSTVSDQDSSRINFIAETLRVLEDLIATLEGRDPVYPEFPEFREPDIVAINSDSLLYVNYKMTTSTKSIGIIERLMRRGLIGATYPDSTELNGKIQQTLSTPTAVYAGFDATSDSLHLGNLVAIMNLLHLQRDGHRVICVVGDATTDVGDPSGHIRDREKLDRGLINDNAMKIVESLKRIFVNHKQFLAPATLNLKPPMILRNSQWYKEKNAVRFVSDVFRHVRVGSLLHKKSIQERLKSPHGMNLSEFCYQVFQAYDWLHLHETYGCKVQVGGMDQSGNIYTGHELIKKVTKSDESFGLLSPLITSGKGEKLGKSSKDSKALSIWLSPWKTSPTELFESLRKTPHSHVDKMLRIYTLYDDKTIADIVNKGMKKSDDSLVCQRKLAEQVTLLLHGREVLESISSDVRHGSNRKDQQSHALNESG